jgi:hypothetical protein
MQNGGKFFARFRCLYNREKRKKPAAMRAIKTTNEKLSCAKDQRRAFRKSKPKLSAAAASPAPINFAFCVGCNPHPPWIEVP